MGADATNSNANAGSDGKASYVSDTAGKAVHETEQEFVLKATAQFAGSPQANHSALPCAAGSDAQECLILGVSCASLILNPVGITCSVFNC